MQKIIFATNNAHKVEEIKSVVGDLYEIISLKEAGIDIDIPEPHDTLKANASEKSKTIYKLTNESCFSEDTGLEVEALNGAPGVKSARYAGDDKNDLDNINKLLNDLENSDNRKARFRTVISLILNGDEYFFEGICEGTIITELQGLAGFGYDPIFLPAGARKTFAQMTVEEKNQYSHRQKATTQFLSFLSRFWKNPSTGGK